MYKTCAEANAFLDVFMAEEGSNGVDVAICPPFTALQTTIERLRSNSRVQVFAQTMHSAPCGAYTGEIAPPMLRELGVHGVILGHSERRELFGETDSALAKKVPAALEAGLTPILCVGETQSERQAGDTHRKLRQQISDDLSEVTDEQLSNVVIAYEPIWAIGTGEVATPEQAQEAAGFIRALVGDRSKVAASQLRVLYGGSVKPENAAELLGLEDVDGALVGGASLEPHSFVAIIKSL